MSAEDTVSDAAGAISADRFVEISYDEVIPNVALGSDKQVQRACSRAGGRNISTGGAAWVRSAISSPRSICAPPWVSTRPAGPSSAM